MSTDNHTLISERLREARIKSGLSQAELADKIGLNASGISSYENGVYAPKLHTIQKISEILNVPKDWLLGTGSDPWHAEAIEYDPPDVPDLPWDPKLFDQIERLSDACMLKPSLFTVECLRRYGIATARDIKAEQAAEAEVLNSPATPTTSVADSTLAAVKSVAKACEPTPPTDEPSASVYLPLQTDRKRRSARTKPPTQAPE